MCILLVKSNQILCRKKTVKLYIIFYRILIGHRSLRSYVVHFFSECLNCYDCTMKFGNSYENRNSSILTKSEKNSFNKMEINYTIFVAVFTSIVRCDVMNTQNRYAGNKMTKCSSLHLPLFKTEWRYFLNSSYLTFFFGVYFYDYEMK